MLATFDLTIHSRTGDYTVHIGDGVFAAALDAHPDCYLIADEIFAVRLEATAERSLLVAAREENKTLTGGEKLIIGLRKLGAVRGDELLGVGGGIVQDLATLVASLYMRGLPWSYVPTTMLGMTDSCIGGKSSINVGGYKNLAGNFHPPGQIFIDPSFIGTLSAEDVAGGLCEAMKINFCRGPEAYRRYMENASGFYDDPAGAAAELIHATLTAKQWFIEVDEFDRRERRLLNFGHTFGHAMEAATEFSISHGIAVGLGILCAERFAVALDGPAMAAPALAGHAADLVARAPDVAGRLAALDLEAFERAFLNDKKHGADGLHVILPVGPDGVEERVLERSPGTLERIRDALEQTRAEIAA